MNVAGLIDIGANLTHPQLFDQLDHIVNNIIDSETDSVIITSSNIQDIDIALRIIDKYPKIFYTTAGFHPHNAKNFTIEDASLIRQYSENKKIIAIGECGLDYYREYSTKKQQLLCFENQLIIAKECGLPIFLHEREAYKDFIYLLSQYKNSIDKAVVHCFTGTKEELTKYIDMGCYIGITGWISDIKRGMHLHLSLIHI